MFWSTGHNLEHFKCYPFLIYIIPHSVLFKRMQIKRIADNIRALYFQLKNWNKEPDKKKNYR